MEAEQTTPQPAPIDNFFGNSAETKPEAEATPAKVEAEPTEKVETPVVADADKKEAAPAEVTKEPAAEPEKKESKPSQDWESDENPFKKELQSAKEREKSYRDWATKVNQENLAIKKQFEIINAKLDGTYDPNVHDPRPDPNAIVGEAKFFGALEASDAFAQQKFGAEFVDKAVERFDSIFANNQMAQARVRSSHAPILEAIQMLKEHDLVTKYGSMDVEVLVQKVKEEAIAEKEKELTDKITKQIMERMGAKSNAPTGLKQVRQSSDTAKETPGPRDLRSFFHQ